MKLIPQGATAFDFFVGSWTVKHRQLKQRLAHCTEWLEFGGSTVFRKTLGGFGNVDDNVLEHPGGAYCAVTLRSFDPATDTWSIWWLDGRRPALLDIPVVGSFGDDGLGRFYSDDVWEGRSIRVLYQWSATGTDRPQWEQAYSTDGGVSWETNWVMQFERAAN